jgi:predicted exporter
VSRNPIPPNVTFREAVADAVTRRHGRILIAFALLFVLAFLSTGRLSFEQDIFKLFPDRNRSFAILAHAMQTSTAQDRLLILVRRPPGAPSAALLFEERKLVDGLRKLRIGGQPALKNVSCTKREALAGDFTQLLAQYVADPAILLTEEESKALLAFLGDRGAMAAELRKSLALMATPGAHDLARMAVVDPLNLRRFMLAKLQLLHQGLTFAGGDYLLSPDQSTLMVMAEPAAAGRQAGPALLEHIASLIPDGSRLSLGITGGFAIAAQEEKLVRGDILTSIAGSAAGIALLFLLVYGNLVVLTFIFIPLAVGLQLAMGSMALFCDRVHMLSLAFAAVILGLGIDFAIHIYDRFHSERRGGSSIRTAVERSVFATGRAVTTGGLTTLCAFLALLTAGSPVLTQIGLLVALGLFFSLLAIVWVLPAWLVWVEPRLSGWMQKKDRDLGMSHLGRMIEERPLSFLVASTAVLLALLPGIADLSFETNPLALKPRALEAITIQQELADKFAGGSHYAIASWPADDAETLWRGGRRVDRILRRLGEENGVVAWSSLSRLASARKLDSRGVDRDMLATLFADHGLALDDFDALSRFLRKPGGSTSTAGTICALKKRFPAFYERFFLCAAELQGGLTWVQFTGIGAVQRFKKDLAAEYPEAAVVTPELAVDDLMASARSGLQSSLGLAALLVVILLILHFKDALAVVMALVPVSMGVAATAGIMGYAGIHLNIFNFIVLPILVGIGLDDGIHILSRYRETGSVSRTIATTGRSVLITTLTTMFGFGSLFLARYHVLSGMGPSLFAVSWPAFSFLWPPWPPCWP